MKETALCIEGWINLLDTLQGDPDFEMEDDGGVEDHPHDQADEGNDEPWLARTEAGSSLTHNWSVEGELDLDQEWEEREALLALGTFF